MFCLIPLLKLRKNKKKPISFRLWMKFSHIRGCVSKYHRIQQNNFLPLQWMVWKKSWKKFFQALSQVFWTLFSGFNSKTSQYDRVINICNPNENTKQTKKQMFSQKKILYNGAAYLHIFASSDCKWMALRKKLDLGASPVTLASPSHSHCQQSLIA